MTTRRDDGADEPRCDICGQPATTDDGIVGAYLCASGLCLDRAWDLAFPGAAMSLEPAAPPPAPTEDVAAPTLTGSSLLAVQGDALRAEITSLAHRLAITEAGHREAEAEIERLAADLAAARGEAAGRWAFLNELNADLLRERDAAIARADLAESRLDGQAWEDLTRERDRLGRAHAECHAQRDALRVQVAAVRALVETEPRQINVPSNTAVDSSWISGYSAAHMELRREILAALDTAPEGRERPATLLPGGDT